MNIQKMMKQAQQMQERLQKQMAELRVEATAGGGMVTVVDQRRQAGAVAEDRSRSRVEGRRRDAAGPDPGGASTTRTARPTRRCRKQMERDDGRPEDPRPVLMTRPDPLARLDRAAAAPARHRRQERAAARLPRPQDAARRDRPAGRRDARGQGARHLLLGLQQHHRHRSLLLLHQPAAATSASSASSRSRRTSRRSRRRATSRGVYHVLMGALSPLQGVGPDDLKIKGLLTRVGERRRRGSDPRHQPQRRRRSDRDLPRASCSSRSASA